MLAVCFALIRVAPTIGLVAMVLALPAWVITMVESAQQRQQGRRLTPFEVAKMFAYYVLLFFCVVLGMLCCLILLALLPKWPRPDLMS